MLQTGLQSLSRQLAQVNAESMSQVNEKEILIIILN